jgi:hypothetical protein
MQGLDIVQTLNARRPTPWWFSRPLLISQPLGGFRAWSTRSAYYLHTTLHPAVKEDVRSDQILECVSQILLEG